MAAFVKVTELKVGSPPNGVTVSGTVTSTAGNALVVMASGYYLGTAGSSALTVSGGGTWTTDGVFNQHFTPNNDNVMFGYASCPSATGGSQTVTIAWGSPAFVADCVITAFVYEFSGMVTSSMLDSLGTGTSGSSTTISTPSLTNTAASVVFLGQGWTYSAANETHGAPTNSWTMPAGGDEGVANGNTGATAYKIVTSSSSNSTSWSNSENVPWTSWIAAYKATAGPAPVTGSATVTLPSLNVSASGVAGITGSATLALQRPSLVVNGTATTVITGSVAFTLAPPAVLANGYTTITSSVALVLQKLTLNASGFTSATLPQHSYSTAFPLTENPMSEGSVWAQGLADGLDWTNIRTTPGKAFATENPALRGFDDSIAHLRGTFTADQIATATVFDTLAGGDFSTEVEILLHFNIVAHSASGYEINWSSNPSNTYCTIVRWNGALSDFTTLVTTFPGAVVAGDVLTGKIVGNVITGYKNGTQVITATDSTFTSGNPGLGAFAYNNSQVADPTRSGLSNYIATSMPVGSAALTLQRPGVAISGTIPTLSGTAALTLQGLTVAASGSSLVAVSGTVAMLLEPLTVAASGTSSATVSGTAALVLPSFVVVAAGWTTVTASAALTMQRPTVVSSGTGTVPSPPPPPPIPVSTYLDWPELIIVPTPTTAYSVFGVAVFGLDYFTAGGPAGVPPPGHAQEIPV